MKKIRMLSTEETELLLNWLGRVQPGNEEKPLDEPKPRRFPARTEMSSGSAVLYHPGYFKMRARVENEYWQRRLETAMSSEKEFSFRAGRYRVRVRNRAPYLTLFYPRRAPRSK